MLFIEFGKPESGTVMNDEIITFKLIVMGNNTFDITIDMLNQHGNPDVYVKLCN